MSHDLRAPLRHIDGFSDMLLEKLADRLDEAEHDILQRIRRSTVRMNQLINDLLTLSRIARAEVRKETVDLTRMVKTIAAELRTVFSNRQIEVAIQGGVSAHGDSRLLRVVMENLLSNAWKYTSNKPQARIEFGCQRDTQSKRIYYVRDDGAGFDMAYAANLFGPFQRLHPESEFPGTGVGLATVQRIIHKHGGHIWAEAAVGEGATFFFTLS